VCWSIVAWRRPAGSEEIDRRERAHGGGRHHGEAVPAACSLIFLSNPLSPASHRHVLAVRLWISVLKISDKLIVLSSIIIFTELAGHFLFCFVLFQIMRTSLPLRRIHKNLLFEARSSLSKDLAPSIQSTQF
jgi:hypothetical protein